MKVRPTIAITLLLLLGIVVANAAAQVSLSTNIYGVHNYAGDLAATLKNGKGLYTVDMIVSEAWVNDAGYRSGYTNTVQSAFDAGFTVIMRIDYQVNQVCPPEGDWVGRYNFGERCKDIVDALKDYCRIWIIGNEMQAGYANPISKEWYTTCFAGDSNGCYDKIHSAQPDAIVCFGGLGGWPGLKSEPESGINYLDYFCKNCDGKVDGFAVHAYGGPANQALGGDLDDPRTSDIGSFGAFKAFCEVIYENFQGSKPVYITESNTYWWIASPHPPHSMDSYQAGWIQKAFQAIDQWNQASDLKVHALCWYSYAHYGVCDGNSGDFWHNAIQPGRCPSDPELDLARADYQWTTANTDYHWSDYGDGVLKIQAVHYNNSVLWGDTLATGWQGTDYNDADTVNHGGGYRPDGVDIVQNGDLIYVGWTEPGEWLRYTVAGGKNMWYRMDVRYAREVTGNGQCHVLVDGENVTGTILCPSTGGWETFATASSPVFSMSDGVHDVRLVFTGNHLNVDWFAFVPVAAPTATPTLTPLPTATPTRTATPLPTSPSAASHWQGY